MEQTFYTPIVRLDDPHFPLVTYRIGASGWPVAVLRGTGIRIQTIASARSVWNLSPAEIAREYDLSEEQVTDALAFYEAHQGEIETSLAEEAQLERESG
ncbi:MAG TPA: DUF433 domain-containing protein [Thermoanaerobaculia bacterium]